MSTVIIAVILRSTAKLQVSAGCLSQTPPKNICVYIYTSLKGQYRSYPWGGVLGQIVGIGWSRASSKLGTERAPTLVGRGFDGNRSPKTRQ